MGRPPTAHRMPPCRTLGAGARFPERLANSRFTPDLLQTSTARTKPRTVRLDVSVILAGELAPHVIVLELNRKVPMTGRDEIPLHHPVPDPCSIAAGG